MVTLLLKVYAASFLIIYGFILATSKLTILQGIIVVAPCLLYSAIFTALFGIFVVAPIKLYLAYRD